VTHPGDHRNAKPCDVVEDLQTVAWGAGRRMRHPSLGDLVYPKPPDRTLNVSRDVLGKAVTKAILTQGSTVTQTFRHDAEDIIIQEIWNAGDLSTTSQFFHMLHLFWTTLIAPGNFVGWYAPDLMPHPYHIKILSVTLGRPGDFEVGELKISGSDDWYVKKQLAVAFKPVRDTIAPSGAMMASGL